ncbi:MAG: hypothetical protein ABGY75_11765 [Gemmataceae bacterium]
MVVEEPPSRLASLADPPPTGGGDKEYPLTPSPPPQAERGAMSYAVLGLGKLGGREVSYHSDLDVVLVYADPPADPTAAHHLFTTLAQRAIQTTGRTGPLGRLYEVDMRLRPTGQSGSLAVSLGEFRRYYAGGGAQWWERQALTRGRVVRASDPAFAADVLAAVREAVTALPCPGKLPDEVAAMRAKLEASASPRSLKRGRGGLTDVEFAVQLLQLTHARQHPEILTPNVWDALGALTAAGLLPPAAAAALHDGYSFLRFVEARLRIVTDRPLTELPDKPDDLARLARRSGFADPAAFTARLERVRTEVRTAFERVLRGANTAGGGDG